MNRNGIMGPTVTRELFSGKVQVLIYGKSPCDLEEEHLFQIVRVLRLQRVYRPRTDTFNARISTATDFVKRSRRDGVTIYSSCLADGVAIRNRGEVVCLRTADCPTIIAYHNLTKELVVAHAGRASLIDEKYLRGGLARHPESVVQAIFRHLLATKQRTAHCLEIYSCCGIGPKKFQHSVHHLDYGSFNKKRNRHIALNYGQNCFLDGSTTNGALDLHRLIRNQFQALEVPGDNIVKDTIDTANQTEHFFSRRGGDKNGHNTILVFRR